MRGSRATGGARSSDDGVIANAMSSMMHKVGGVRAAWRSMTWELLLETETLCGATENLFDSYAMAGWG